MPTREVTTDANAVGAMSAWLMSERSRFENQHKEIVACLFPSYDS